ncbi:MAG: M28 family peptidase [Bryobacteraceae bacterium]|nr:M28 family peptidase [Bryobacteraceae bacterium]
MYLKTLVLLVAATVGAFAQIDKIEGERIRAHVRFLSDDLLEGRAPGTRGDALAARYIAAQMAAAGLTGGAEDGSFFQRVPLMRVEALGSPSLTFEGSGGPVALEWLEEFAGHSQLQREAVNLEAELVFVGHGIRAPEYKWDDYAGVDVRGKVVVLFTNEPPSKDAKFFGGPALTYYGRWTYKYEEALRQGAAGVLIVHTDATAGYGYHVVKANGRPQPQVGRAGEAPALGFAGWITQAAGEKLFKMSGNSVESMLKRADTRGFRAVPLNLRARLSMKYKVTEMETYNVVGKVAGNGAADEAVVFSAHLDHLGVGDPVNGDAIYNGALDNATGCALLIEIGRAWAQMEPKPRRSALFVAVTAEESGLLGSEYFARNPVMPAAKIAAAYNFDTFSPLGRVRDAVLNGAERLPVYKLIQGVAERHQLTLKPDPRPEQGSYFRSDHFSFAKVGIPAVSVGMGGDRIAPLTPALEAVAKRLQGVYHTPADEYTEDWDFSGMEQFGRFGFALGLETANLPAIPARIQP